MPKSLGFTLIELMVVIAIIAVLSVVGVTIFTTVQNNAVDTRKKADLNAMLKAYDLRYSTYGSYKDPTTDSYNLNDSDFSTGKVPTLDGFSIIRSKTMNGIRVCAQLGSSSETCNQTTDPNCFCKGTALEQSPIDDDITDADNDKIAYITTPPASSPNPSSSPASTPPPPPPPPAATNTNPPTGYFEAADCTQLRGWTCDNDSSTTAIPVNFYDGSGLTNPIGSITANINRGDLVTANVCGGTGNHGFTFVIPSILKDGLVHNIDAYGTNINSAGAVNGTDSKLLGSPRPPLTCNPSSGSNLLNNPGFESGWSGGWGGGTWSAKDAPASTGTWGLETTVSRVGSRSVKVTHHGPTGGTAAVQGNITGSAGDTFCISGWIKKSRVDGAASIHFKDPDANPYKGTNVVPGPTNTTNWQYVRGSVQTTSAWSPPLDLVLINATSETDVWFDNIWVSKGACN